MEAITITSVIAATAVIIKYLTLLRRYKVFIEYHDELITLNKKLTLKISERTKELEKSFEKQVESIYTAALMGKIAQPMIHDIATPVSALRAAFLLIKKKDGFIKRAEKSVEQIIRIIEHARELMLGNVKNTNFSPNQLITNVIFVLSDKLNKSQIKIVSAIDKKVELHGSPEIFERVVINILLNSIEELENCEKKNKQIIINSTLSKTFFYIQIEDNGRGIKSEQINKIFEANFSSKGQNNLGFGLCFVKEMLNKYFKGDVQVKSDEGKFTKFILKFKI